MFLQIAENFSFYLPVYLPFVFALLSIIAGIASGKIQLNLVDLLKVHGDMTLGLFSFVTWALVTYMQTKMVALNTESYIEISHIVFLLIINFGLLLFSIIAIRHSWPKDKVVCKVPFNVEKVVNGFVLLVSIFCAFLPLMLIKPIYPTGKDKNNLLTFSVVLPYQDSSLINHVGFSKWDGRHLCDIQNVMATDKTEAIKRALEKFNKGSFSKSLIQAKNNTETNAVRIDEGAAVADLVGYEK